VNECKPLRDGVVRLPARDGGLRAATAAALRQCVMDTRAAGEARVAAGFVAEGELFSRVLSAKDAPEAGTCYRSLSSSTQACFSPKPLARPHPEPSP